MHIVEFTKLNKAVSSRELAFLSKRTLCKKVLELNFLRKADAKNMPKWANSRVQMSSSAAIVLLSDLFTCSKWAWMRRKFGKISNEISRWNSEWKISISGHKFNRFSWFDIGLEFALSTGCSGPWDSPKCLFSFFNGSFPYSANRPIVRFHYLQPLPELSSKNWTEYTEHMGIENRKNHFLCRSRINNAFKAVINYYNHYTF